MDYLTSFYKNKAKELEEQIAILKNRLKTLQEETDSQKPVVQKTGMQKVASYKAGGYIKPDNNKVTPSKIQLVDSPEDVYREEETGETDLAGPKGELAKRQLEQEVGLGEVGPAGQALRRDRNKGLISSAGYSPGSFSDILVRLLGK